MDGVKIYRTAALQEAGAEGLAVGNTVLLSEQVDLNSHQGQDVLGHELYHIVSQRSGEVQGVGLKRHAELEHQAEVQG